MPKLSLSLAHTPLLFLCVHLPQGTAAVIKMQDIVHTQAFSLPCPHIPLLSLFAHLPQGTAAVNKM